MPYSHYFSLHHQAVWVGRGRGHAIAKLRTGVIAMRINTGAVGFYWRLDVK